MALARAQLHLGISPIFVPTQLIRERVCSICWPFHSFSSVYLLGYAAMAIQPVLQDALANPNQPIPCYLEATSLKSSRLYEKNGFHVRPQPLILRVEH